MTSIQRIRPEGLVLSPAFSHVAIVPPGATTIYVGGQNAVDADGSLVGEGDVAAQSARALQNAKTALDEAETVDGDHGRIEVREAGVSRDIAWLQEMHAWPGLQAVGKVTARRETRDKTSVETRYFLLSRAFSAARFAAIVRAHWSIENGLHWVLDVTLNEDQQRHRKGHGPENLALLRRLALNLAKLEPSRGSMKGKLKHAGWDDTYLATLITQAAKIHMR